MNAYKEYKLRRSIRVMRESSDQMTPWELALQMVDAIPPHLFNTRALVPGSGMGTFALALVYRGWSPDRIVCIELDVGFALYTKVRSPDITTIHTDFLTWQTNMQFDVVIGNPPYSLPKGEKKLSDGSRNLAMMFVEKSTKLLKEGGFISFLTPPNFLKPTDSEKPTKAFKSTAGLQIVSIKTGVQREWFPGIGTNIVYWTGIKSQTASTPTLNGQEWDLEKIPFIVDLTPAETKVFAKVWKAMKSGPNPIKCKRVGDGNLAAEPGWALTERVNRRKSGGLIPWSTEPVKEKYEQIWINMSPEKANAVFSQPHVVFFLKAIDFEPTVYHNLLNGLDYCSVNLTEEELSTIQQNLSK